MGFSDDDGLDAAMPANRDYRTCAECGRDCTPDSTVDPRHGARILFVCEEHGAQSIVDPWADIRETSPPRTFDLVTGDAYELTTEHGTRIIIDRRPGRRRWMRLPSLDGPLNLDPSDGKWQRLAGVRPSVPVPAHERARWAEFECPIRIGESVLIFKGVHTYWMTTAVVDVRVISDNDIPTEAPATLDDDD